MVARDLAEELGNAKVISIAKAVQDKEILSDECIGFVFPMYYQVMPLIVQDFIEKLQLDSSKYIFAIVTSGAFVGHALDQLSKLLSRNGAKLSAGYQLLLPYNYIINPFGMKVPDDSKQEKLFNGEKQKVKAIAEAINERAVVGIEKKPFFLMRSVHPLSWSKKAKMASKLQDDAKNFWTNDQCKSCRTCKSVCPVNNIEMANSKPKWLDHCQQCLACIHWCPEKAIQYGKRTLNKKRYTNPSVTVNDMVASRCKRD